jgi:hypothetical protein
MGEGQDAGKPREESRIEEMNRNEVAKGLSSLSTLKEHL